MNTLIIGAGSWGSTLAYLLTNNNKQVSLLTQNYKTIDTINKDALFVNGINLRFKDKISIIDSIDRKLPKFDLVVFCCTSQSLRLRCEQLQSIIADSKNTIFLSAVKGIEHNTFYTMTEIIQEFFATEKIACLSGPNLSIEILNNLPCATVVASLDNETAIKIQQHFNSPNFRVYINSDVKGVQIGGAYKNVIAIACGISDGLKLGYNAKASLITRGLREMIKIADFYKVKECTIYGLSGIGDLIATSSANNSRNYSFGYNLASGCSVEDAKLGIKGHIEGIPTTYSIIDLAGKKSLELPICSTIHNIIESKLTTKEAIRLLMSRPLTTE